MYSGIVESLGVVTEVTQGDQIKNLTIKAPEILSDCKIGDSLNVNGVCLTVVSFDAETFHVNVVAETLRKTNLGSLSVGSSVNVERCINATTRIGGHYIQGHVDTTISILDIQPEGEAWNVTFSLPIELRKYIVKKGFVGLDGMSITVVDVGDDWFSVTFIPHTQVVTRVKNYYVGTLVNLEVDMMAKYIENMLVNYA